jgi:hypothetical protein
MRLVPSLLALALFFTGCTDTRYVCIAVTTSPPGADIRLGAEDRIVGTSPTEPIDVPLPPGEATITLTATMLDYSVGRKIITMAHPHATAAEARQDIQRFHFDLTPKRR